MDAGAIFAALLLLSSPTLVVALVIVRRSLRKKLQAQQAVALAAEKSLSEFKERFKNVFDAEIEARRVTDDAQAQARRIEDDARKLLQDAEIKLVELKQQQDDAQTTIDGVLKNARMEAASLLKAAQKQAEELTGEVGRKVQDTIDYEKAVKALRNKLDGYGDEYLVPPQTLLDDLAEDFGYAEAGTALKRAREYSRQLIKTGSAATCDYAEENRKKTAVAFVLDAFNGKVDSIQARMRHDNAGKLQQEAKDAFSLVNANGKAFRDARIQPGYLLARLEEIKWGAAAFELRERAREEQRALKEQMREEERARREYEKALREAEKEEEKAQLALDKAKLAYEQAATESARQKMEERIKEFEARLAQAKANEAKAISMAELTKSGHVYVISNIGSFGENIFKIGMTRRLEPLDRVKELGDASVPFPFDVHAMLYSEDAPALEFALHSRFNLQRLNKVNYRREFFKVALEDVSAAAHEAGVKANFTMLAQALEYKESRAIEALPREKQEEILSGAVRNQREALRQRLLSAPEDTAEDVVE